MTILAKGMGREITNLGDCVSDEAPADKAALIFVDLDGSHTTLTYADVHRRLSLLQTALNAHPVAGQVVGVVAGNSADYLLVCLAIMRAGGTACPINWKLADRTVAAIFQDAGIALAICDAEHADKCPDDTKVLMIDSLVGNAAASLEVQAPAVPHDPAFVMYTSGSTGMPKGVPISHSGYLWGLRCQEGQAAHLARARTLVSAPMYHMNAQCTVLISLAYGGTSILLPRFDVDLFLTTIVRFQVTTLSGVPTMLAMAINRLDEGFEADLSSVEHIGIGSAPLSENLLERIKRRFDQAVLQNGYGTTETGFVAFGQHPDPSIERPPVSIGYPHPAVEVRLDGPEAPEKGVLWLKTGMMPEGYLHRPEATAEKFVDGWYRTGDIMRRDEQGFYYFVEREDDMFVSGGINIFPGDVERLLETHPDVQQAAVLPLDHELKGQVPVAFVVRMPGGSITEEDLKGYTLAEGPAYAHPRRVFFLDALPLAGTNKIDKAALKSKLSSLTEAS